MGIIKLKNVSKFYYNKSTIASGFNKINLELDMGEFVVITGESGSGKSTLLNVISGLDSYEEGEMYINGEETSHYTEQDYEMYRRKYIGNIFQHFNLVNSYTVYQNLELVLLLNGYNKKYIKKKILDIINIVGLSKYKNTKTSKLSGGQKQRVAIARALLKDTPIIVADEPTGNLDVKSASSIMKLLHDISKDKLVVIVTHNYEQVSEYATRRITMHDGKIIEDKELQKHNKIEAERVEYGNISFANKLRLGIRNAFNLKIKFILLFLVYFFLTSLVCGEYSSIRKVKYDQGNNGYNIYFQDNTPNRVILNKKDKSPISKSELEKLKTLDNIDNIVENDIFLDTSFSIFSDEKVYLYGSIHKKSELDKVNLGSITNNSSDVIIEISKDNYYLYSYKDELFNLKYKLQDATGIIPDEIKLSGIKYSEEEDYEYDMNKAKIYVSDELYNRLYKSVNYNYSDYKLALNNHILDKNSGEIYRIVSNKKLDDGYIYLPDNLNYYCNDFNCNGLMTSLKVKNIYYEDNINLRVNGIVSKDNFKKLTDYKNYVEAANTVFMSEKDYDRLFSKATYQISVFLNDTKKSDETLSHLNNLGYNTYYMRDLLYNRLENIYGIINIIRGVIYIVATVALFFISYFIIKIIMKSRNTYFATVRILGATKKQSNDLLNIELLTDANIAYFVTLILVALVRMNIFSVKYLQDMLTYFKLVDYILVYIVLMIMSLLISNRYAHKLFKKSAMSTYRGEE